MELSPTIGRKDRRVAGSRPERTIDCLVPKDRSDRPTVCGDGKRQVARRRSAKPNGPADAAAAMTRTTFDIIVEAMLGGSAGLSAERFGRVLALNFETIPWHLIYTMFSVPEWVPFPRRGRAMQARDFLHRLVKARRAKPSAQPDLLDVLLAARDPESGLSMSDAEVVKNLLTFIAAHETTAVALTWTFWLLAKDQDVQQRLFDEVAALAGREPDRYPPCRRT